MILEYIIGIILSVVRLYIAVSKRIQRRNKKRLTFMKTASSIRTAKKTGLAYINHSGNSDIIEQSMNSRTGFSSVSSGVENDKNQNVIDEEDMPLAPAKEELERLQVTHFVPSKLYSEPLTEEMRIKAGLDKFMAKKTDYESSIYMPYVPANLSIDEVAIIAAEYLEQEIVTKADRQGYSDEPKFTLSQWIKQLLKSGGLESNTIITTLCLIRRLNLMTYYPTPLIKPFNIRRITFICLIIAMKVHSDYWYGLTTYSMMSENFFCNQHIDSMVMELLIKMKFDVGVPRLEFEEMYEMLISKYSTKLQNLQRSRNGSATAEKSSNNNNNNNNSQTFSLNDVTAYINKRNNEDSLYPADIDVAEKNNNRLYTGNI